MDAIWNHQANFGYGIRETQSADDTENSVSHEHVAPLKV